MKKPPQPGGFLTLGTEFLLGAMSNPKGTVYLIHLDSKIAHAQHYIGWSQKLKKRVWHHRNGSGALFLAEAARRGIAFDVVRKWAKADKNFERKLKNRKKAPELCPVCRAAKGKAPHKPRKINREVSANV